MSGFVDAFLKLKRVSVIRTPADLAVPLDSSIAYILDGVIDMTDSGYSIEVPSTGLTFVGFSLDNFGIVCNDDDYTLFTSPDGGSGNLFLGDMYIQVDGTNSSVFALEAANSNVAMEFDKVNFINCTSRGYVDGYRQGLEVGCGMFGGAPSLELRSAWSGGYRISTTNVFGVGAMTEPLFKAGAGFTMQNRFITDINADIGPTAAFFDFSPSNFPNDNTVQLNGAQIQRNGVFDPSDSTITPNMSHTDLCSKWVDCVGLRNTSNGGKLTVTSSTTTTISAAGNYYDLAGTWTASDLDHFSSPDNGQIQNDAANPQEYICSYTVDLIGGSGDEVSLRLVKWDDSSSSFVVIEQQTQVVENRILTTDRVLFSDLVPVNLDEGDYLKLQVANLSDTTNVTADTESFIFVGRR